MNRVVRKGLKFSGLALAGAAFVFFVVVAGFSWRLSRGPIDAAFLTPLVESALSPTDNSYKVRVGATKIDWEGWSKGVSLRARNVRAIDANGATIVALPHLSIDASIPPLFAGNVVVTRLSLIRPRLVLERDAAGQLHLGLQQGADRRATIGERFVRALAGRPGGRDPLGRIELIEIVDGRLTISDPGIGRTWETRNFEARLTRGEAGVTGNLSFDLTAGEKHVLFTAAARHDRMSGMIDLTLRFAGLDPALFATARGTLSMLSWVRMPLSGQFRLRLTDEGHIRQAALDLTGGKGALRVPSAYEKPLPVASLRIVGRLTGDGRTLTVETFRADLVDTVLIAKGVFRGSAKRYNYRGVFGMTSVPVARLKTIWPDSALPTAKKWVTANISKGSVSGLQLTVDLDLDTARPEESRLRKIDGRLKFRDLSIRYYKPLPLATGVTGSARFDKDRLTFDMSGGRLQAIKIGTSRVSIFAFDKPVQEIDISARIAGPLPDILKVIDRRPLEFARKLGVTPHALKGAATGSLRATFPLRKEIAANEIAISAKADVEGLEWNKGLFGLDLSRGEFSLGVDRKGLMLEGAAHLDGEPAKISWREAFGKTDGPRRRFKIESRFTPATLVKTGLDIRSFMSGVFGAKLDIAGYDDGRNTIDGDYDFRDASFVVPILNIRKPVGMAARGTSRIVLKAQRISEVPRFSVTSPVIIASGRAAFHADGETIRLLRLDKLVAGRTNLAATITGRAKGAKIATVTGRALDMSVFLKSQGDSEGAKLTSMTVKAKLARLFLGANRYLSNFTGAASFDGARWRTITVDARVGAAKRLTIRFDSTGPRRLLRATAQDAGAALRALNIADQIKGGVLDIDAAGSTQSSGELAGTATIKDFRVTNAPAMARLLALVSRSGQANYGASDKGLEFTTFRAPFRVIDGVVYVKDGRAVGSQIGITMSGALKLADETARLSGTVVPLYSLNSALGKVPLLGRVLVGEKGSGLFAARYTLDGPLKQPKVSVNPLSVLTPGVLRRLFDIGGRPTPEPKDQQPKAPSRLRPDPNYSR